MEEATRDASVKGKEANGLYLYKHSNGIGKIKRWTMAPIDKILVRRYFINSNFGMTLDGREVTWCI